MNPPEQAPQRKLDIQSIERSKPLEIDSKPNAGFQAEEQSLSAEKQRLENERLRAELGSLRQDIRARKIYAALFYALGAAWVAIISLLLFFQGFGRGRLGFRLPDSVLLAAIGSTTANLVGIVYVVANYLFPARKKSEE
jgi:hypothetical protein